MYLIRGAEEHTDAHPKIPGCNSCKTQAEAMPNLWRCHVEFAFTKYTKTTDKITGRRMYKNKFHQAMADFKNNKTMDTP